MPVFLFSLHQQRPSLWPVAVGYHDRWLFWYYRTHNFPIYIMVIQLSGKNNPIVAKIAPEDRWPGNSADKRWHFYKHHPRILDRQKSIELMEVAVHHTNPLFNSGVLGRHSLYNFRHQMTSFAEQCCTNM